MKKKKKKQKVNGNMQLRNFGKNNYASAVPLILFIVTIIGVGALYTLLFLQIAQPSFEKYIPASDSKTFIMMILYAVPGIILITGVISLLLSGLKREAYYGGVR